MNSVNTYSLKDKVNVFNSAILQEWTNFIDFLFEGYPEKGRLYKEEPVLFEVYLYYYCKLNHEINKELTDSFGDSLLHLVCAKYKNKDDEVNLVIFRKFFYDSVYEDFEDEENISIQKIALTKALYFLIDVAIKRNDDYEKYSTEYLTHSTELLQFHSNRLGKNISLPDLEECIDDVFAYYRQSFSNGSSKKLDQEIEDMSSSKN
ncbi:MAG: hypothetical protein WCR55_08720 [Lentisphaerota bacterium]